MQQQKELTYREKFNIVVFFLVVVQRAIVIITRKRFGRQAIGKECAFGFFLIWVWAVLSRDVMMYGWLAIWCACLIGRWMEATKAFRNSEQRYSYSDGETVNLGKNERLAKQWYEPLCIAILGMMAFWYYEENDLPVRGLPLFLFCGAMCIRVVESIKIKVSERRMMTITDGKMQQEWMVREHQNRYGD